MKLDATVLCLDDSEWMRNGDFSPTRLSAQSDAINFICGAKLQPNPENSLGVITMARPKVVCSLTHDIGKILNSTHLLELKGNIKLTLSLLTAKLVLRHRSNKRQTQRIIAFIGSPIEDNIEDLTKVAKILRKANISLDFINFGEIDNSGKLENFLNIVNKNKDCNLIVAPGNSISLVNTLTFSSVFETNASRYNEYGVDPNIDPDLAIALQISAEEECQRQEELKKKEFKNHQTFQIKLSEDSLDDERKMLLRALSMSLEESEPLEDNENLITEDEQITRALQLSLDKEKQKDESGNNSDITTDLESFDPTNSNEETKK